MRALMLALLWLFAVPAFAQTVPAPAPAALPRVVLETTTGRIVVEVETVKAPITAANFLRYVDAKRLDGVEFYRIVKLEDHYGIVQFGLKSEPRRAFPAIRHEPTTVTGLKHTEGTISMARNAPGTARAEFTLMVGNQTSLDADPGKLGDNVGYAAFGRVVEGMDVVVKILDSPIRPGAGPGAFAGEVPVAAVKVLTARRMAP